MYQALFDFLEQYITLDEAEKKAIVDLNIFYQFPKGKTLLEVGQKTQNNYFVLKGCLRIHTIVEGEEKTTGFYTEMQGFTPTCVKTKTPSQQVISCSEDCMLFISDSSMEKEMFEKFPKFESLCRALSEDLLSQEQIDFEAFRIASPEQRYLNLLEKRPDLIQRVPQHQLASYLGMKPQSLSRIKARLIEKEKS